jgi:tyrosyl-tRNA synthetase
VLVATGLAKSRREARGFLEQGGVYLNNRKVADADASVSRADLLHDRYAILRRGKGSPHLLRVNDDRRGG